MQNIKRVEDFKKLALMTPEAYEILSDSTKITPISNNFLLYSAIPILRRIARDFNSTPEDKQKITEFLNYLEALIDQYAMQPWEGIDTGV